MNLFTTVLIVFVVLVILYYILDWTTSTAVKLSHIKSAMHPQTLAAHKVKKNKSSNFTYSIWFYVDNWEVNLGNKKNLFVVKKGSSNQLGGSDVPLSVEFEPNINNMKIKVECFTDGKDHHKNMLGEKAHSPTDPTDPTDPTQSSSKKTVEKHCNVDNFPLQKWVNLIISVEGRTLDVYIDGKLVKTCVLPGTVNMSNLGGISVTDPGFSGMTADLTYWGSATNPQQAYNIYASGFGGMGSNFFNKYKLRIAFLEDGKSQGHFDI